MVGDPIMNVSNHVCNCHKWYEVFPSSFFIISLIFVIAPVFNLLPLVFVFSNRFHSAIWHAKLEMETEVWKKLHFFTG